VPYLERKSRRTHAQLRRSPVHRPKKCAFRVPAWAWAGVDDLVRRRRTFVSRSAPRCSKRWPKTYGLARDGAQPFDFLKQAYATSNRRRRAATNRSCGVERAELERRSSGRKTPRLRRPACPPAFPSAKKRRPPRSTNSSPVVDKVLGAMESRAQLRAGSAPPRLPRRCAARALPFTGPSPLVCRFRR